MKENIDIFGDDMDDIDFAGELENSSFNLLFSKSPEYNFIQPDLGLDIDTSDFLNWLELAIGDDFYGDTYAEKVGSMCEFSCLYLAMKFFLDKNLAGEMRLVCGNFGFYEHWWVEYAINDKVYIIDLTLQQFVPEAPELSITEASYHKTGYYKDEHCDYSQSIKEYCLEKGAFKYYPIPKKKLAQ